MGRPLDQEDADLIVLHVVDCYKNHPIVFTILIMTTLYIIASLC